MKNLFQIVNEEDVAEFFEITDNKIYTPEFAGLKDKVGRDIHFGDILVDDFDNMLTPVVEVIKDEHVLFFKPINLVKSKLPIGCKSTYSNTLLVIDNIFESFYEKHLH